MDHKVNRYILAIYKLYRHKQRLRRNMLYTLHMQNLTALVYNLLIGTLLPNQNTKITA